MEGEKPTPATPRPAASIVLMRRGGKHEQKALEVLLLKRTDKAAFMPGAWVFPGGAVDPEDGEEPDSYRTCAVRELREEASVELAPDAELVPFCRWITPTFVPRRFDAWFFLTLAPPHAKPECDGRETVDVGWFAPTAAVEAAEAGEIDLPFPTRTQLDWLSVHATADDALAAYRGKMTEPVLPEVVGEGDDRRLVLPGLPDSIRLDDITEID